MALLECYTNLSIPVIVATRQMTRAGFAGCPNS